MKSFVSVLLLAAVVAAGPPQYRYRFQRQELASGAESEANGQNGDAPYAPAGFRPAKAFNLPARQEASPPSTSYGVPDDSYGAPLNTYAAPQAEYGAPSTEYGVPDQTESDKEEVEGDGEEQKEEIKDEKENGEADKANLEDAAQKDTEVVNAQGVYYVLLPGAQLQRVQFQTQNDLRNMAYTARLQYKDEDRAPVYVYSAVPQYQSAAYVQLF
ncbi:hypothetical protein PYW07_003475 [Mythimna separata]|uniref:DUF4794 domain-containing protein n=1 Tax=Mythimna separata TaxID=271217 RepID=A0AAD7YJS0_MYTSE|nr:hypothetical protein PYW07_003475 [Mythimna separata]